jgi:Fuc2NAc and GlcNAc transferase
VLAIAALAGCAVSVAAVWLVVRYGSRIGLLDVPNARSAHVMPIPRGGGIGILAGAASGFVVYSMFGTSPTRSLLVILVCCALVAALGALDDFRSIPALARLGVQTAVAIVLVVAVGPFPRLPLPSPLDPALGWLASPLTVLWLVAVANFFNFMDGIDGIAGGQAVASSVGVVIAAWSVQATEFAVVVAAGCIGFLLFNRPPARVFLGDVGSTALGFGIAAMPLLAPPSQRHSAVLAIAIGLSLFLLDPVETLARRARRGLRVGVAHREHSYQRLASRHGGRRVAGVLVILGLIMSVAGALVFRVPSLTWPVLIVALVIFVVERWAAQAPPLISAGAARD